MCFTLWHTQSDLIPDDYPLEKNVKLSLWADTEKDSTVVNCELFRQVTDSFLAEHVE